MGVRVEISGPVDDSSRLREAIRACIDQVVLLYTGLADTTEDLGVSDLLRTLFVLLGNEFFSVLEVLFLHL